MEDLKQIDNYIFDKLKEFNIYNFLNPINSESENQKFLDCFKKGIEYNPQYKYDIKHEDHETDLKLIKKYKNNLKNKENFIFDKMYNSLEELEQNINLLNHIGDNEYLTDYSKKIYGCPYKDLIDRARKILELEYNVNEDLNLNSNYCKDQFEKVIKNNNLKNWSVELNEKQLAKVIVHPGKKTIKINKNAKFSENDIKRLIIHELGTHVLRSQNGSYQPYKIFSKISEKNLYTEEGLATVNEDMENVLDIRTFRIYAGRVLAVHESLTKSFYEVFCKIKKYFCFEDALYIVSRVKRGIENTANKGAFTKDYVYLHGYYKVKEFIKTNPIENLYIGAIGIDEVIPCMDLVKKNELIMPEKSIKNFKK